MYRSEELGAIAAASTGFPDDQIHSLFISQHENYAVVLLETGSVSYSYPYMVLCEKGDDGHWDEVASSNFPGWYQTEDDLGVVVYWDEAVGLDEPIEVLFGGRRWPAQAAAGLCFVAFWEQLDPGNHIDPPWPVIATAD